MGTGFIADLRGEFDLARPERVVSLVPSVTASIYDLGLSQALAGITQFCPDPPGRRPVARLGGPKDFQPEAVLALQPDLVIANREENNRQGLEALAAAGVRIWLTFPVTVREAIEDLKTLASIFRSHTAMIQVELLEKSLEWAEQAAASRPAPRCFCPIWQDALDTGERWWMTFNGRTYPHDVLRVFNVENAFASRERCYPLMADLGKMPPEPPGARDTRYPRVSLPEIVAAQPSIILLPSEPYAFGDGDCADFTQLFASTPAAKAGRIFTLDGSLLTWHGTRLARALEELPVILDS